MAMALLQQAPTCFMIGCRRLRRDQHSAVRRRGRGHHIGLEGSRAELAGGGRLPMRSDGRRTVARGGLIRTLAASRSKPSGAGQFQRALALADSFDEEDATLASCAETVRDQAEDKGAQAVEALERASNEELPPDYRRSELARALTLDADLATDPEYAALSEMLAVAPDLGACEQATALVDTEPDLAKRAFELRAAASNAALKECGELGLVRVELRSIQAAQGPGVERAERWWESLVNNLLVPLALFVGQGTVVIAAVVALVKLLGLLPFLDSLARPWVGLLVLGLGLGSSVAVYLIAGDDTVPAPVLIAATVAAVGGLVLAWQARSRSARRGLCETSC